jgi:hypothetical protein
MGESKKRIAASSCDSENNGLGTSKAHHVSSRPQKDRGVSAGKVGEIEGASEESGIDSGNGARY